MSRHSKLRRRKGQLPHAHRRPGWSRFDEQTELQLELQYAGRVERVYGRRPEAVSNR